MCITHLLEQITKLLIYNESETSLISEGELRSIPDKEKRLIKTN